MIGRQVSHEIALRLRQITARFATNERRRTLSSRSFFNAILNFNEYPVLLTERSSSFDSTKA